MSCRVIQDLESKLVVAAVVFVECSDSVFLNFSKLLYKVVQRLLCCFVARNVEDKGPMFCFG